MTKAANRKKEPKRWPTTMDLTKPISRGTAPGGSLHMTDGVNNIVERVAQALMRDMFAPHELPLDDELQAKYRGLAVKAIRATGVGLLSEIKSDD